MIKVAIELNDSGFENDDISKVKYGNPGWGGSEYLFAELAVYLSERNNGIEVYLFHYNCNKVPFQIKDILIEEPSDLIKYSKEYDIDILIHQVNKTSVWYNELADTNVKVISWAHIYPPYDEYKSMMLLENVKRVIFVGKEEYDAYIDTNLIEKADVVYNMFNTNIDIYERKVEKPIVTYIGSLVPQKGFHILASVWKDIKKAVPDAELMVIGTGQVYDKKSRLGKYGIAQEDYG